ncbi:MgtC/SapB family protein [Arthrobacter sp. D3-16]
MTILSSTASTEFFLLGVAFILCGIIGVERQVSQKSAGMRTHMLVGLGSAGFTLISAYGFAHVKSEIYLDPSRIAAQIVSGVGFLGAGVIFLRRDVVRGLTTAASIWLTAAVGMACGAGLVSLAAAMTVLHIVAMVVLGPIVKHLPSRDGRRTVSIRYEDGRGVLRSILGVASEMGFRTVIRSTKKLSLEGPHSVVLAVMQFHGRPPLQGLMAEFSDLPGVEAVRIGVLDNDPDE